MNCDDWIQEWYDKEEETIKNMEETKPEPGNVLDYFTYNYNY